MSDEKINYSKKGQRKITQFIGQELIYDYVMNKLDIERTHAVEEYLKSSREGQLDIQKINNAMTYLESLSETVVSDFLTEEIKKPSTYLDILLRKTGFDEWPKIIKVSFEFLVVSVGVISVILVIPWHRIMEINFSKNREIVLLEVEKAKKQTRDEIPATESENSEFVYPDDDLKKKTTVPENTNSKKESPPPQEQVKVVQNIVAAKSVENKENKAEKKQGFLYRGEIYVANLPVTTQKFVDYITEIGGRKAGGVPIGWTKGNSTYFHFTMPESKFESLQVFLTEYGEIKLQKLQHDRVMPDDIVRVIITVYEKK